MSFFQRIFGGSAPAPQVDQQAIENARKEGFLIALDEVKRAQASQPWPMNIAGTRQVFGLNNPWSYAVSQAPGIRPGTLAAPLLLRQIADVWDPARACIQHLKREVRRVPFSIVARDQDDKSETTLADIKDFEAFLGIGGGVGGAGSSYRNFESKWLEDVLVTGCLSIYCEWSGGRLDNVMVMDSTTIRPVLDEYGWPVEDRPYEQWIQGVQVRGFAPGEIIYDGVTPTSWQPYYRSPLEWLQAVVLTAMSADAWNRDWLTEGTTPGEMISLPEGWTPSQIREFKEFWDSIMVQTKSRRQMRFVPSGSKVQELSRKDQEFSELEMHLIRRTCSVYGVSPIAIGFEGSAYKVSQENAMTQTAEVGTSDLLELRLDILNTLLEYKGYAHLQAVNQVGREEAANDKTKRLTTATGRPYMTVNEARAEAGLDPIEGGDQLQGTGSSLPAQQAEQEEEDEAPPDQEEERADLARWRKKAVRLFKAGDSPACSFVSRAIPETRADQILSRLSGATTEEAVRSAFAQEGA